MPYHAVQSVDGFVSSHSHWTAQRPVKKRRNDPVAQVLSYRFDNGPNDFSFTEAGRIASYDEGKPTSRFPEIVHLHGRHNLLSMKVEIPASQE
jgi:hypothetical protein